MLKKSLVFLLFAAALSAPAYSQHREGDVALLANTLPKGVNSAINEDAIKTPKSSEIRIYPDKTNNMLYIQSLSPIKVVYISDKKGKLMLADKPMASGKISIPVHNLKNGTYLVRVNAEKGAETYAFSKL